MPHLIYSHILKLGSNHSSRGIYVFGAKIYKDKKTQNKISMLCKTYKHICVIQIYIKKTTFKWHEKLS